MHLVARWFHDLTWVDRTDSARRMRLPAMLISLLLHFSFIVVLGTIWIERPHHRLVLQVTVPVAKVAEPPLSELQHFRFSKDSDPRTGSPSIVGAPIQFSTAPIVRATTTAPREVRPVENPTEHFAPQAIELASAPSLASIVQVKGAAGIGAVGTVGAVDRITQEILLSLEERKTLVVWMFDRSTSMQDARSAIAARMRRIYQELGMSDLAGGERSDQPLLSSVVAFSSGVDFMTEEPTAKPEEVQKAVTAIQNDESGVEMVFSTVGACVQRYQAFRVQGHRNLMFVIFTDEVGDDEQHLEAAIQMCRRCAAQVYVVGVPAPFGRRNIEIKYVDPDPMYDQSVQWIPVRQGPETAAPELVQVGFAGRFNRDDSIYRLDSGFGPYALTRLCYETGGIYFAVHPKRDETGRFVSNAELPVLSARLNYFFDPAVMRPYAPDYGTFEQYQRAMAGNKAKLALVQAAQMSIVMPMEQPRLDFPKFGDEAEFKRNLDDAQKKAAVLEPKINGLFTILKQGEPDRAKLESPRWQADFDLSMGRVLAVKVRTEGYNAILAKAKLGMKFADKKNNVFVLKQANDASINSALEKQARQAREYLERVMHEHSGTPWAMLAKQELDDPIGWKWDERFETPPNERPQAQPNPGGGGGGGRPRPSNLPPPKPLRQPKL
jgi:hypothetical protein